MLGWSTPQPPQGERHQPIHQKLTGGQDMNIIKVKHYQQPKAGYMVVVTQKEKKTMLYIVLAVIVLATLWAMGIEVYL